MEVVLQVMAYFVIGMLVLVALSLLYLICVVFPMKCGYYNLPPEYHSKVCGYKLALAIILAFTALFLAPLLTPLFSNYAEEYWNEILSYFMYLATLVVYLHFYFSLEEKKGILGENFFILKKVPKNILFGLLSYLALIPPFLLVNVIFKFILKYFKVEIYSDQNALVKLKTAFYADKTMFFLLLLIVTVIVPIIEEIIFRGFIQNWIKQYSNRFWAIISTSVLFAALHLSFDSPFINAYIFCELFIVSFFLGFVFERQQSLVSPIVLHSVYNSIIVYMYFFFSPYA